ncbi:DUF397 domain-containing protein [Streptomyces aurantiacus]|uniref:DUF397 domain-containing protein n=1 Tax=Streptomyces aurantiacus TaxID=47760 RepID=A0A7G1P908_9ACTN|nr:DUF397 domain-containing protein [Streptomyces aurantiacus]BCL30354.1 hypothetical protein GCM10017557_52130 [Streptomyces aurantiacus]
MVVRSEPRWFKSSYSGGSGTECVECAHVDDLLHVRDSKRAGGPVVAVRSHAWRAFIRALEERALMEG